MGHAADPMLRINWDSATRADVSVEARGVPTSCAPIRSGTTTINMISSTSTTSTSGVMLISDCRLEPESLLLNCMMSLSFCSAPFGDQPHPAEAGLLDRDHDLADLAEIELCIAPDHDLGVRFGAPPSVEGLAEMLGGTGRGVDPQPR